ncbi:hypothetical protein CABS01_15542 [Colletotrichum abscissum]|uniref:uncharacterized protein n=1 Tax=Colletotrichum abscissum TaxID=1671311 RepID=UPI0027D6470A|nr:uncharacterized protein CABS01_15542 [Colletotrichum abscissum]KAK1475836.1 hypothetical protein CABS01_15542 [Colletotrichum abscissum]
MTADDVVAAGTASSWATPGLPSMRTDINSVPPNSLYTISAGLAFKAAHSTLSYIEENASSLADFVGSRLEISRGLPSVGTH